MQPARFLWLLVLLAASAISAPAVDVPQWLTDAARLGLPDHSPETSAVILFEEQTTNVGQDGKVLASGRRAVKILREGGVEEAGRLVLVGTHDCKILSMTGWNVTEGRKPVKVTMKDVVETGLAPDTLYSDVSMKILPVPGAGAGSLLGFEWEEERRPPSLEEVFEFQGGFPVGRATYSINLPPGWSMDPYWVNWTAQDGRRGTGPGPSTVWELKDIPAVEKEPMMPPRRALAGRLVVHLKRNVPDRRSFLGWADMGAWYEALSRECRVPNDAISRKARELTTASAPDTLSRLRALAEFTQKEIRYVAIEIGIGGFKPHSAASVLSNRYGDCKDKATLLASLLESVGIASHYLLVHADRGNVTRSSPVSLYSFNHAVLAIRLPDDVPGDGLPALIVHPKLGRLLVFDPTFSYAPLGRLPVYLQGNTALLVAEGSGELISLPLPAPESNLLDRRGRFTIQADGTLDGEIQEIRRGTLADETRYALLNSTSAERAKFIETFLANFFAGFVLQTSDIKNLDDNSRDLLLSYGFRVPNYAKAAGGMIIVRPRVVGDKREKLETNDSKPRRYPIDFRGTSEQLDEFTIELPEGCRVESLPPGANIDLGFAVYKSSIEEKGRVLLYRREYRLVQPALPADRYGDTIRLFRAMDADQRQSVLLKK
jgi:hypothetical protein